MAASRPSFQNLLHAEHHLTIEAAFHVFGQVVKLVDRFGQWQRSLVGHRQLFSQRGEKLWPGSDNANLEWRTTIGPTCHHNVIDFVLIAIDRAAWQQTQKLWRHNDKDKQCIWWFSGIILGIIREGAWGGEKDNFRCTYNGCINISYIIFYTHHLSRESLSMSMGSLTCIDSHRCNIQQTTDRPNCQYIIYNFIYRCQMSYVCKIHTIETRYYVVRLQRMHR